MAGAAPQHSPQEACGSSGAQHSGPPSPSAPDHAARATTLVGQGADGSADAKARSCFVDVLFALIKLKPVLKAWRVHNQHAYRGTDVS